MTNEEFDHIHESQRQTAANLEALAARQDRFQEQLEQNAAQNRERMETVEKATLALLSIAAGSEERFSAQMKELGDHIDVVVTMVEKWIAEDQRRRNGNTK